MVGQHDAPGADANALGSGRQIADDHRGGGTGDTDHVVMLGYPEPVIAHLLRGAGQIQTVAQGVTGHRSRMESGSAEVFMAAPEQQDGCPCQPGFGAEYSPAATGVGAGMPMWEPWAKSMPSSRPRCSR